MCCHPRLLLLRATAATGGSMTSRRSTIEMGYKMHVAKVDPPPPIASEVFCSTERTIYIKACQIIFLLSIHIPQLTTDDGIIAFS
jgi:hypothetical protein